MTAFFCGEFVAVLWWQAWFCGGWAQTVGAQATKAKGTTAPKAGMAVWSPEVQ